MRLALLDPEPGFWGNASYFGEKNLLSIGLGGQFQAHGSSTMTGGDKNWAEVNVDVLFEKKLGGTSFVTAEGAYYHNNVNDGGVERLVVRARRLRHAHARRRQHPADGPLSGGED